MEPAGSLAGGEAAPPAPDCAHALQPEAGDTVPADIIQARPSPEFVRESLSQAQLMARASVVVKRYTGKLLPESCAKMTTNIASTFLVCVFLFHALPQLHPHYSHCFFIAFAGTA